MVKMGQRHRSQVGRFGLAGGGSDVRAVSWLLRCGPGHWKYVGDEVWGRCVVTGVSIFNIGVVRSVSAPVACQWREQVFTSKS